MCRALECITASRSHAFLSTMHHSGLHRGLAAGMRLTKVPGDPRRFPGLRLQTPRRCRLIREYVRIALARVY